MSEKRYFNFPIELLAGFMNNTNVVLGNIFDYCIYKYMHDKKCCVEDAEKYFGVKTGNHNKSIDNGEKIYKMVKDKRLTGINESSAGDLFWSFYKNNKSDFDKAVLLAFLAVKSIVGNKQYYKLTNQNIWFNRIAGQDDDCETLPKEIAKYCTRYQFDKIKIELNESYKVSIYAYHTRGQYVSLKMSIEELAQVAESRKHKTMKRKIVNKTKDAYLKSKPETDTDKELKRIQDFLALHPELKDKICT